MEQAIDQPAEAAAVVRFGLADLGAYLAQKSDQPTPRRWWSTVTDPHPVSRRPVDVTDARLLNCRHSEKSVVIQRVSKYGSVDEMPIRRSNP